MPKKKVPNKAERVERLFRALELFNEHTSGCIVGIDPGRVSPGIAIVRSGEIEHLNYKTKATGFGKVMEVEIFVKTVLAGVDIAYVLMEDYAYQSEWNREAMGEMGGIIMRYFWRRRVPVLKVAPVQIKNFIGAGSKDQIMKEVLRKWKINTETSDEADATVLSKIGLLAYNIVKWYARNPLDEKQKSEFESKPHKFIKATQVEAGIVNRILISRGEEAYGFAQNRKETEEKILSKKAGKKERRKKGSNKKSTRSKSGKARRSQKA